MRSAQPNRCVFSLDMAKSLEKHSQLRIPYGSMVNVYITMENHHFIAGKIHYFDWAMASSSQTVNVYQRIDVLRSAQYLRLLKLTLSFFFRKPSSTSLI